MKTPDELREHLWEVNHAYYCNEGNYYASGCGEEYSTWDDFHSAEAAAELDYNLVFRWDWQEPDAETDPAAHGRNTADPHYRGGRLLVFFMGQRKGMYRWAEVRVCRADEPAVIAYLRPRWEHMRSLWAPFQENSDEL